MALHSRLQLVLLPDRHLLTDHWPGTASLDHFVLAGRTPQLLLCLVARPEIQPPANPAAARTIALAL
jgi:hypothetical protein